MFIGGKIDWKIKYWPCTATEGAVHPVVCSTSQIVPKLY